MGLRGILTRLGIANPLDRRRDAYEQMTPNLLLELLDIGTYLEIFDPKTGKLQFFLALTSVNADKTVILYTPRNVKRYLQADCKIKPNKSNDIKLFLKGKTDVAGAPTWLEITKHPDTKAIELCKVNITIGARSWSGVIYRPKQTKTVKWKSKSAQDGRQKEVANQSPMTKTKR